MVHSEEDLEKVLNASNILFSKNKDSSFSDIDEETFTQVFDGVPTYSITNEEYNNCYSIEELLKFSPLFKSKSDVIRSLKENSVSINKEKIDFKKDLSSIELIHNKYLVIQRGKKIILSNINLAFGYILLSLILPSVPIIQIHFV